MTDTNIEHRVDTLLKSGKPMVIAGSFNDITELTEQQIRHFKTAEYLVKSNIYCWYNQLESLK